ncbi:MAG: PEP-CTERM sorting domain-containing protein [Burkholderiales bacterium]
MNQTAKRSSFARPRRTGGANWRALFACMLCASLFALCHLASATPIKVLWYTYADPASEYVTFYSSLAGTGPGSAGSYPESGGITWDLTFFGPSSPVPVFSAYDVLVIHSGEAFRTQPPGGATVTPDYAGILTNRNAIEAARGNRTLISGADADFHAVRGDSGLCPGAACGNYDGARGYVINAVDWAASGAGLGIVSFYHGEFAGSFWWDDPSSFLKSELQGNWIPFHENAAVVPASAANLSLDQGLTSSGLSNWGISFHGAFTNAIPGYISTVDSASQPGYSLSIATVALCQPTSSSRCISATLDEPSSASLLAVGALAIFFRFRNGRAGRKRPRSDAHDAIASLVRPH